MTRGSKKYYSLPLSRCFWDALLGNIPELGGQFPEGVSKVWGSWEGKGMIKAPKNWELSASRRCKGLVRGLQTHPSHMTWSVLTQEEVEHISMAGVGWHLRSGKSKSKDLPMVPSLLREKAPTAEHGTYKNFVKLSFYEGPPPYSLPQLLHLNLLELFIPSNSPCLHTPPVSACIAQLCFWANLMCQGTSS